MSEVFLRQSEATSFVNTIPDQVERALTEIALNRAISFLLANEDYRSRFSTQPFDLLFFVRTVHAVFQRKDVLSGVLDGDIKGVAALDPFR